jgi:ATP-dependent protease ClpP protease subunit
MTIASQVGSAEFFVLPDTKTLLMMGKTERHDFYELRKYIENENINSIILQGPGGDLSVSYEIADLIIKHEIDVILPSKAECLSACALIFVAGKNRKMEEGSTLGFHLPYLLNSHDGKSTYCDYECRWKTYQLGLKDTRKLSKLLLRDGISEKVLDIVIETNPTAMRWITQSQAAEFGLTTTSKEGLSQVFSETVFNQVKECWVIDHGSVVSNVNLTVAMILTSEGKVESGSLRLVKSEGGTDRAKIIAFEAARRAILRCQKNGYHLPKEKYGQWKEIELNFNP